MKAATRYEWSMKVGTMFCIREEMLDEGRCLKTAMKHYGVPRSTVYRWLREFGIRHHQSGKLNWDELNAFLLPSAQRWTSSKAVHGSELLFTY